MTITLTPETEEKLRQRAARDGKDPNRLADALLADALDEDDPDDLTDEQVAQIRAGVRRGLDAAAAGRERPLSEYVEEVQRRRTTAGQGGAVV